MNTLADRRFQHMLGLSVLLHGALLLPGHGQPAADAAPIRQTRAWLVWLAGAMRQAARDGLDMNEVLARPLPPEFARLPLAASEYRRSVGHLFPAAEQAVLEEGAR